ncbi:hypothetical protein DAPPUDRAFT_330694 [Daphnia pulex]|uniref:Uncharacterized protein n=1 Tax=Daphnia pulex TaxID=6669 RepID=E9HKC8_DAPPU|nr:hypothetical protein DAPPUDRAFT_330694 [Daphnia pulex]|eukprot:EFX67802.1 hypothetical protein DAPPUDRAFT_330694 [Daphnia pulex]
MPRRRNSKASRAIRAAIFKESKVRRQEVNALQCQQAAAALAQQAAPVIAPERLAADIQLGEEILRAVQAQRRIISQHLLPPLGVLVQQAEANARNAQLARILLQPEPIDDVLQVALVENEEVD